MIRFSSANKVTTRQLHTGNKTMIGFPYTGSQSKPEKGEIISFTEPVFIEKDNIKTSFRYEIDNFILSPFGHVDLEKLSYYEENPPLWSSRLIYESTLVKCKKINDLNEDECKKLGVEMVTIDDGQFCGYKNYKFDEENPIGYFNCGTAKDSYKTYWDNTFEKMGFPSYDNPTIYLLKLNRIRNGRIIELIQKYLFSWKLSNIDFLKGDCEII